MSLALNNAATADGYTAANEIHGDDFVTVTVQLQNAAAFLQFGVGYPVPTWDQEEFYAPFVGGIDRNFNAVKVRSAIAGTPARVTLVCKTAQEVP